MYYGGIEIGGTKLQLVLGDEHGRILERHRFSVDPSRGGEGIRSQITEALPRLTSRGLGAIGVGFGGPVDCTTGRICCSHQIEGWAEFDLKGWLQNSAKCPVVIENDANVAALGEATHGAGAGLNPVFYITLGSGVGGGLVADRRIYHGVTPGEAEIGHVRLDREGTIVEERCSGWAVDRQIRELCATRPNAPLAQLSHGHTRGEARFLAQAIDAGDEHARKLLLEVAGDIAFALSHVTHLFHPEIIVLGGGLSKVGAPLRAAVSEALPNYLMNAFRPGPEVALASLGEDAVPVGALVLAAAATK